MKAATTLVMLLASAPSPWATGPLQRDRVVVEKVVEPKVSSGTLAIFAKVIAATESGVRRDYFILYMGADQTLPAIGSSCDISYREGQLAEWRTRGNLVERFACNDGRQWEETPHRP